MRYLIIVLVALLFVGCIVDNNDDRIVGMIVNDIYYAENVDNLVYVLQYDCELWEFIGCPLEDKPEINDVVKINIDLMEWVTD